MGGFFRLTSRQNERGESSLDRFTRELERAAETGGYIVMLVEHSLADCLAYNSAPHLKHKFSHIKVSPEHIFHNLRALLHQFPLSFQALFVDGRSRAANAVVKLLGAGPAIKRCDLQWLLDSGQLTFEESNGTR